MISNVILRGRSASKESIIQSAESYSTTLRTFGDRLPVGMIYMKTYGDYLITIFSDGVLGIHKFNGNPDGKGLPFTVEADKLVSVPNGRELEVFIPDDLNVNSSFALGLDGKILFHSGFWDNGVKVYFYYIHYYFYIFICIIDIRL